MSFKTVDEKNKCWMCGNKRIKGWMFLSWGGTFLVTSSVVEEPFRYRHVAFTNLIHSFGKKVVRLMSAKRCIPGCRTDNKDGTATVKPFHRCGTLTERCPPTETAPGIEQVTHPKGSEGLTEAVTFELVSHLLGVLGQVSSCET